MTETGDAGPVSATAWQGEQPAARRFRWFARLGVILRVLAGVQVVAGVIAIGGQFQSLSWVSCGPGAVSAGSASDVSVIAILAIAVGTALGFAVLMGLSDGVRLALELADGKRQ